jgi:hypothetical protein
MDGKLLSLSRIGVGAIWEADRETLLGLRVSPNNEQSRPGLIKITSIYVIMFSDIESIRATNGK